MSVLAGPNDAGEVRLRVEPVNGGPTPQIFYAEDGPVSERSQRLTEPELRTRALRVAFLVKDPTNRYETGEPYVWENKLTIRNRLVERDGQRWVELLVAPRGEMRYTLDGSEPRFGAPYTGPFAIGDDEVRLLVFAEAEGLQAKEMFTFGPRGRKEVRIINDRPARLKADRTSFKLDSRAAVFEALKLAIEYRVTFENIYLTVGQGAQTITLSIGDIAVDAEFLMRIANQLVERAPAEAPVTMTFKRALFQTGHDAQTFSQRFGIQLAQEQIEQ